MNNRLEGDSDNYVNDAELVTYVLNLECRNLTELRDTDEEVWRLVCERGLDSKVYPELQEPDCSDAFDYEESYFEFGEVY